MPAFLQFAGMKGKYLLSTLLLSGFSFLAQGQDSLRVMFYNLTNYGNNIAPCTAANNGVTLKNPEFKTIMQYVKPDILGVCEMNTNPAIATSFLNNVLNVDGITSYKRSNQVAESSGTITSVLFYNSDKLVLANQAFVSTSPRLTHHFRLYCKTESLAAGDTIWVNVLAGHFKAGSTTADATERANATAAIRTYLNNFPKRENFMIMGDFNTYTSSETAFQNLVVAGTRPTYQFLDPVNRVGSWGSNAGFADVHTQCPRTDNNGGCYSGGGLDDRFDFILMNRHLLNDSNKLKYVAGTYKALGNDGQHYNKAITASPTNTSVPAAVLTSLFKASDHLPVVAKLRVGGTFTQVFEPTLVPRLELVRRGDRVEVLGLADGKTLEWEVLDLSGRLLRSGTAVLEEGSFPMPEIRAQGLLNLRVRSGKEGLGVLRMGSW
jgi:exonuclease III